MYIGPYYYQWPLLYAFFFSVGALYVSYYFVGAICIVRITYY